MALRAVILALPVAGLALAASAASPLAPVDGEVASTHGPYEARECGVCHEGAPVPDSGACRVCHEGRGGGPGLVVRYVNQICFDCHDDFSGPAARRMKHPKPEDACTRCHNPHNSWKKKLLLSGGGW